jgi:nitrogen fixation protein NifU and related proteins
LNTPDDIADGLSVNTDEVLGDELYRENVLDHYKHPHNKRSIPNGLAQHGVNPFCGDELTVFLDIQGDVIRDVAFTGTGCAISVAAMSMLTELLRGKQIATIRGMGQDDVIAMLGIPIGAVRMKCAMLGLRTTQRALDGSTEGLRERSSKESIEKSSGGRDGAA